MAFAETLGKRQLDLFRYSNDPVAFTTDLIGLECKPFHQEWLDAFESNKFTVLLSSRGSGKCVKKGSLVTLPDGGLTKIENCRVGNKILSLNNHNKFEQSTITGMIDNGIKDVYTITLNSGKQTTVTSNHPFYVGDKWLSMDDGLVEGMRIAIPQHVARSHNYNLLADEEIKVLALLIAEGNIATSGYSIGITSSNINIIMELNDILPSLGAYLIPNDISKGKYDYRITKYEMVDGRTSLFTKWIRQFGIWGKYAYEKTIPNEIFRLSNSKIKLFLKYLWMGDGTINLSKDEFVDISYSTSSRELSRQVQTLLEYIGIPSNVYLHRTKKRDGYQVVLVGGKSVKLKFLDNILEQKNYSVREVLENKHEHSNVDTVPRRLVINGLSHTPWQLKKQYNLRICNKQYDISNNKIKRLIDIEPNNQKLRDLYDNHIRWDWIKSIKYGGKSQTYGLEVSGNHNHIIDGIISHNTSIVGSYILWRIATNRKIRVLIVTINQDKANDMMSFIQSHLAKNLKLNDVFGEFRSYQEWSRNQIRVKQLEDDVGFQKDATLKVLGVTSRIISGHYDLVILDDITDDDNSRTETRRKQLEDWYNGPLVGTFLGDTSLINIGTRWGEGDIHSYLSNKPGFTSLRYKALLNEEEVEEGKPAKVIWPEHLPWDKEMAKEYGLSEDVLTLKFVREHQGETFFQMQYQNNIVGSGISKFKPQWIDDAIDRYMRLDGIIPSDLKKFIGVDFGGEDVASDWCAFNVSGVDSNGDLYVLDQVRTHTSLHRQVDIVKSLDDKYGASRIGMEAIAQQKIITDDIIKQNPYLPIYPIKSSRVNDRGMRTDRLSLLFETGRVYLNPKLTHLIDELRLYPRARHDDCLDSLCFSLEASQSSGFINWDRVPENIKTKRSYDFRMV